MAQRNPRPFPVLTGIQREVGMARIRRNAVVDDESGCWVWQRALSHNGYGKQALAGTSYPAHRISYVLFVGPFDPALDVDHLCRNRACVNPEHLEPVTPRVNLMRSTNHVPQQLEVTHCPKGHEYTAENLRIRPSGRRACRACQREWSSNRYHRIRSGEHTPSIDLTATHCKNGHEFTPENTVFAATGTRQCKACRNAAKRARNRRAA